MIDPYTRKMPRLWRIANTCLCFLLVIPLFAHSTPPSASDSLAAWTACRSSIDRGAVAETAEIPGFSEVWSAVVILRKDGKVLGVGDSHEANPIFGALKTALADARVRTFQSGANPESIKWNQVTLELELGSKPEPLVGGTYEQAAHFIEPALDGIAVRRGGQWAVAHPAVLQALNAAATPDQSLLSLVMQLGLPAREFAALPTTERVGLYRFDATRLVQPTPEMAATFVHRGSRIEPTPDPIHAATSAHEAALAIFEWFERSFIRPSTRAADASIGEQQALEMLGLRGNYLPAEGRDESINAAPAEQALAAFAIARFATLNSSDADLARRARLLSVDILAALHKVAPIERDPLADRKTLAWIVMTTLELGSCVQGSPAATALGANAKDLLAKEVLANAKDPEGILRGDPLEQALTAAALATFDRAGQPLVDRAALVAAIDSQWTGDARSSLVGVMGWLLWADRQLGAIPATHTIIARAARAALSRAQLGLQIGLQSQSSDSGESPTAARVAPDLVGSLALAGIGSKGATAQTARPGYALALMMTDPTLTLVGEQYRARAMQIGIIRFLRQLGYDEVSCYLVRDLERASGAIRTAPWESSVAVAGNAMALLCLEESAFSVNSLNLVLESSK